MKIPDFSIIMPAYNCERFVGAAIESVLNQDFDDFELIVIDDGSSDGTLNVVRQLAEKDNRLKILSAENVGKPSMVRNRGLSLANGKYLAFLDADDIYLPGRLRRIFDVFEKFDNVAVVLSDFLWIDENGKYAKAQTFFEENEFLQKAQATVKDMGDSILACNKEFYGFVSTVFAPMNTNSITIRRSYYSREALRFNESLTLMEDFDLWFRVVVGKEVAIRNECLSAYRKYGNSISSKMEEFRRDQITVHTWNFTRGLSYFSKSEILKYKLRLSNMYGDQGYEFARSGKRLDAAKFYWQAVGYAPQKWIFLALLKLLVPGWLEKKIRDRKG